MKKIIKMVLFSMTLALLIPFTTFASTVGPQYGAGEWDYLGSESIYANDTEKSNIYYSGGGNLKACVSNIELNSGNDQIEIELMNDDGFIVRRHYEEVGYDEVACHTFVDLGFWVDYSNDLAEFYFNIGGRYSSWNPEYVTLEVWD